MKTDDTPELIEILDEETVAFTDDEPRHQATADSSRRWIAPVAAAVLVGLIIYGVVTSASGNTPPEVAPVTTTIPHRSTTTLPAPTTTVPAPRVPYYAAEPPREYRLISVDYQGGGQFQPYQTPGTNGYQLWAKPSTNGSYDAWFSLNYYFGPMGESIATNAYRLDTGNGHTLVSVTAPGRLGVQTGDSSGTLDLQSFGWTSDDLLQLAQSVTVDAGVPSFPMSALTDGYEMVSPIDPWSALEGFPLEQIYYAIPDKPTESISLLVGPLPDMSAADFSAARQAAARVLLEHATGFTANGLSGIAGQIIGGDYALASWVVDGHMVSLAAKMSVAQLIEVAQSVHEVSDAEFRGMQFQAIHNTSEANAAYNNRTTTNAVTLWTGALASGENLSIDVSMESVAGLRQVDWFWGLDSGGYSTPVTDDAQINTFVDMQHTFVLADLPRAWGTVATLRIMHDGAAAAIDVPFVDTDPTLDRTFAAYAFSESGPYTAQIVGPDGSVLVSWPGS